jgi:hypothetical protein
MNKHYLIVLLAFLLAQALLASIMVYNYQKERKITWLDAMEAYLKAEIGYFIIGLIGILSVCFLLSDFIDLSLTKHDLENVAQKNWKVLLQLYFKTSSFIIGGFIQYIAFKYRDKGKTAIDKAADKIV